MTECVPFTFDWFPGTNKVWGRALAFEKRPLALALVLVRQIRAYLLSLIDTVEDAGARHIIYSCSHSERGWEPMQLTVNEMLKGYTEHLREHIAEIGKIRTLHGI